MMWTEKLVGTMVKSLPTLTKLVPERHKKITALLNDHNPFASLGATDDLLLVSRIAWIESVPESSVNSASHLLQYFSACGLGFAVKHVVEERGAQWPRPIYWQEVDPT